MTLRLKRYSWEKMELDIAGAVDHTAYDQYGSEPVDRVEHRANAVTEILGRLLTRLHEKGVFDDEDVLEVIGAPWKKVEA